MKAHLNPFAPGRVQRLLPFDPHLIGSDWQRIASRWQALGQRAAVRGHHGSGKTTFLDAFADRLAPRYRVERLFLQRGHRHLSPAQRALVASLLGDKQTILFVDGEGHLSAAEQRWLRKVSCQLGGYLVARHHWSRLPTLLHLKSNPQLATILLEKIYPPELAPSQAKLAQSLRHHRGNLRELWLSYYDHYARL